MVDEAKLKFILLQIDRYRRISQGELVERTQKLTQSSKAIIFVRFYGSSKNPMKSPRTIRQAQHFVRSNSLG